MKVKVVFRVTKECRSDEQLAVLGNIPELGDWKIQNPFVLEKVDYAKWEGSIFIEKQKIEFKFAVIDDKKNIREWEVLDKNSNRKYKVTESVALKMEWSNPQGKAAVLKEKSNVKGVLSIVIKHPPTRTKMKKGKFNPFKNAEDSQSEDDLDKQPKNQRRQSFCTLNKKQFLQLFYQPSRHRSDPFKLQQRMVILSKYHPFSHQYYKQIFIQAAQKCTNLVWIYAITLEQKIDLPSHLLSNTKLIELSIQNKTPQQIIRLFQLKSDQVLEDKTICIALDIQFCQVKLNKSLNGLMLGGPFLDQTSIHTYLISKPSPPHFTYISFQNPKFNEYYLTNMIQKLKKIKSTSQQSVKQLELQIDYLRSVQNLEHPFGKLCNTMATQLNQNKSQKQNTFEKLSPQKLYKSILISDKCLYIFDFDLLVDEQSKVQPLFNKVIELEQKKSSLIIIISEKSKECVQTSLPQLQTSRIIVIAEKGLWVKLTHEWINTNSRHEKNIEILKKWFKNCLQKYQGSIQQNKNYLTYKNPSEQLILRLSSELKSIIQQQTYIKLQTTQTQLIVKWSIDYNRCIDAVIQFRCMCEGSLDFIFLMITDQQKSYIVVQIQKLLRRQPLLFKKNLQKYYVVSKPTFFKMVTHYIDKQDIQELKFIQ